MKRIPDRLSDGIYDLCVIGGGIYGSCIARDAAQRGLRTALVEKDDFGRGTTFHSQKTIHGGFRYLQNMDLPRIRSSVEERRAWFTVAPHLVYPSPFLIPTYRDGGKPRWLLGAALLVYDLLSLDRNRLDDPRRRIPRGRLIDRRESLETLPELDEPALTGGAVFHDGGIHNSERLLFGFLRSAAEDGATLVNYTEATGLILEGGRAAGVRVRDRLQGDRSERDVRARFVVNAAGPWAEGLNRRLTGEPVRPVPLLKVMYLIVRRPVPRGSVGLLGRHGRYFFLLPWHDHSLVGIAEFPVEKGDLERPAVREEQVEGFLAELRRARPGLGLRREDAAFVHTGLLPADERAAARGEWKLTTKARLIDHAREGGPAGLLSVVGIKFTMARRVAEGIVDRVFRDRGVKPPPCRTGITPLWGGSIGRFDEFLAGAIRRDGGALGEDTVRHLARNYGGAYPEVLAHTPVGRDPGTPFSPSSPVIAAEAVHAVREEAAMKLADVVFRRTELGLFGDPGDGALEECAAVVAAEAGWDGARTKREIDETREVFRAGLRDG
ncbi:MAG: glycerol-3-phosphate dehydrogenase/oxidase [Candidatus Eisenbacteria bacterium]|nr:glycerol-3-phosphate dehydrogenase/oxidase [Candidatus Eisenbacteria bacterium]